MRGKPKGIARKTAAGLTSISEKHAFSMAGHIADCEALAIIEEIRLFKWEWDWFVKNGSDPNRLYTKDEMQARHDDLHSRAGNMFIRAALDLNVSFFRQCSESAEWMRDDQGTVRDPKAVRVLWAVQRLVRGSKRSRTISSDAVVKEMEAINRWIVKMKSDEAQIFMDTKDVRDVLRGLGLWPIDAGAIIAADAARVAAWVKGHGDQRDV